MPTYEYAYERNGEKVVVERHNVPMSQSSDSIEVVDTEDGNRYIAERIFSVNAHMNHSWSEDINASDLPPKHWGPDDVKRHAANKSKRARQRKASTSR